MHSSNKQRIAFKSCTVLVSLLAFLANTLVPAYAQIPLSLPAPGTMIGLTAAYNPASARGLVIHPENPLRLDFIVDSGDSKLPQDELKEESNKLIKYFLAALTVPEKDLWVNLSPTEKDRIIPQAFGTTEMGRDLLAGDYILKQLTSSLLYPDGELGRNFWKRVNDKAKERFGASDVSVSTLSKVWIVPDKAVVYSKNNMVYVTSRHLKVMLDQDYVGMQINNVGARSPGPLQGGETPPLQDANVIGLEIIREIILPELEKEVNSGEHFAQLRQIYDATILATWFKRHLRQSILAKVYVGQNKVGGVDIEDKNAGQGIYEQYLAAFNKGAYSYIKEEYDPKADEPIPRKYFSGGVPLNEVDHILQETGKGAELAESKSDKFLASADFSPVNSRVEIKDVHIRMSPAVSSSAIVTQPLADIPEDLLERTENFGDLVTAFVNFITTRNYSTDEMQIAASGHLLEFKARKLLGDQISANQVIEDLFRHVGAMGIGYSASFQVQQVLRMLENKTWTEGLRGQIILSKEFVNNLKTVIANNDRDHSDENIIDIASLIVMLYENGWLEDQSLLHDIVDPLQKIIHSQNPGDRIEAVTLFLRLPNKDEDLRIVEWKSLASVAMATILEGRYGYQGSREFMIPVRNIRFLLALKNKNLISPEEINAKLISPLLADIKHQFQFKLEEQHLVLLEALADAGLFDKSSAKNVVEYLKQINDVVPEYMKEFRVQFLLLLDKFRILGLTGEDITTEWIKNSVRDLNLERNDIDALMLLTQYADPAQAGTEEFKGTLNALYDSFFGKLKYFNSNDYREKVIRAVGVFATLKAKGYITEEELKTKLLDPLLNITFHSIPYQVQNDGLTVLNECINQNLTYSGLEVDVLPLLKRIVFTPGTDGNGRRKAMGVWVNILTKNENLLVPYQAIAEYRDTVFADGAKADDPLLERKLKIIRMHEQLNSFDVNDVKYISRLADQTQDLAMYERLLKILQKWSLEGSAEAQNYLESRLGKFLARKPDSGQTFVLESARENILINAVLGSSRLRSLLPIVTEAKFPVAMRSAILGRLAEAGYVDSNYEEFHQMKYSPAQYLEVITQVHKVFGVIVPKVIAERLLAGEISIDHLKSKQPALQALIAQNDHRALIVALSKDVELMFDYYLLHQSPYQYQGTDSMSFNRFQKLVMDAAEKLEENNEDVVKVQLVQGYIQAGLDAERANQIAENLLKGRAPLPNDSPYLDRDGNFIPQRIDVLANLDGNIIAQNAKASFQSSVQGIVTLLKINDLVGRISKGIGMRFKDQPEKQAALTERLKKLEAEIYLGTDIEKLFSEMMALNDEIYPPEGRKGDLNTMIAQKINMAIRNMPAHYRKMIETKEGIPVDDSRILLENMNIDALTRDNMDSMVKALAEREKTKKLSYLEEKLIQSPDVLPVLPGQVILAYFLELFGRVRLTEGIDEEKFFSIINDYEGHLINALENYRDALNQQLDFSDIPKVIYVDFISKFNLLEFFRFADGAHC